MRNLKYWAKDVLATFAPYFEPLKSCATAWRQFYVDDNLTYDAVLGVLQDTLLLLEDIESWSQKDDPAGYGDGKKRKRLARIIEEDENTKTDEDDRPRKVGRSENGDPRVVQSELDKPKNIIRSMKGKQPPHPSLVGQL
ncbi:hypothetical protein B0H19DRAFT_1248083 [Mycena capillaripes]|nr:hypothetical protein B0H19DRAFT_1248083 [Mycena capillaripes]